MSIQLNFVDLHGIGTCPRCDAGRYAEHLIATIRAQLAVTWAEEHDHDPLGWQGAA